MKINALINISNIVNIIYLNYTRKISFCTRKTNINMQKIDIAYLNIFKIIVLNYLIKNKLERV